VSADAFAAPAVDVVRAGELRTLTPSLYGSRKTGLPHVPVAPSGWEIAAGETAREQLFAGVARGAVVGRLSMGNPAANGDFSGVIKNSFRITDGVVGTALAETMVSGNMARMLRDIVGVSRERIDSGGLALPWIRVANLHFS
jgi:PmbA protein